jgi:hypothetical protein
MFILSLLALAFLALLGCLAFAAVKVFGAKNAEGRVSAPGCLGGCAMALVLTLLGVAGLATFLVAAAVATSSPEMNEAAREISAGIREGVGELRRELRTEIGRARRRAPRDTDIERFDSESTDETDESDDAGGVVGAEESDDTRIVPWRARVVVSWSGHGEPDVKLLDMLDEAGLDAPIDVEVDFESDETDGDRSLAILTGSASLESVGELRRRVEEALERAGAELGAEFELVEVRAEDLR